MFFPTAYEMNEFNKIEVLDITGEIVLFITSSKEQLGKWLCEQDMIVTNREPLELYEDGVGTVCVFNAHKVQR